jgi:hypothetical protein
VWLLLIRSGKTIFIAKGETGYGSYMFGNADMLTAWLRESMVGLCQLIWTLNGSFTRFRGLGDINAP